MTQLDVLDRMLLEQLQVEFPLASRPFAALGEPLDLAEDEVLARVRRLKAVGIIRQIGAIFDTQRLGYQSTLAAFHVDDGFLESMAAQVSAHLGVSHNYARPHYYNLWFTLAVPPGQNLDDEIQRLAQDAGVGDWLNLPALRVFKIRAHFRLDAEDGRRTVYAPARARSQSRDFATADIPYVRALQKDLCLVPRPFSQPAEQLGLREEEFLDRARELGAAGIMRRFSAVLRHRRVGYQANGMACWVVPEAQMEQVGYHAAEYSQVSHCYERPARPPGWPYTLFTMIHGQTVGEVKSVVAQIAQETEIESFEVLYSTREFKKERVRYYEEVT